MEGVVSSSFENPESPPNCEILIVHTAEAEEWAIYLQRILKSSRKFLRKSIVLYTVGPADYLHGYNFEHFHGSKCIVPLLTLPFLDLLCDPEVLGPFQRLLHQPHRVVALLCGVLEEDVSICNFEHWRSWRKLYTEDEPALYISTILEAISDSKREEADSEIEDLAKTADETTPVTVVEISAQENKDNIISETLQMQTRSIVHHACLTVQPNRVLCGDEVTLYIILTNTLGCQSKIEVEFSSNDRVITRIPGIQENEYTVSVASPDVPAGEVSLTLYSDESSISLSPVTYYTRMGEISSFLENASAPMEFMCQAFNITSKATETLDTLLTDSVKCRMPANGLQLFGIRQIEESNMATYQRNEELPTLLHFAAKYGLKNLTTVLLQCPGALQAYSVMNKHGYYPNTLAEKSGFSDLRQFMDEFVETADMLKSHIRESMAEEEDGDVYESMSDNILKYSLNLGCREDIYESMIDLNPDCMEDLYESMEAVTGEPLNSEEAMLRKFFTGREGEKHPSFTQEEEYDKMIDPYELEEDPYDPCIPDQIYDTVDENASCVLEVLNRPPAPIPRPVTVLEPKLPQTFISRVFSSKEESNPQNISREAAAVPARPVRGQAVASGAISPSTHDPYAGMKTPGQRQLIALQERVKVGAMSVDEAVQEFKAWQFDQERRSNSIRFQQENLKKLRDSIYRRHKYMEKMGKELDITSPLPNNCSWGTDTTLECAVYESSPQVTAPPPPVPHPIQRGTWQKGSTSSTSSSGSNRLSTHSTISYSSGTEPDFEEAIDYLPPPPRPPRPTDASPSLPPPRIPPRVPERVPEKILHERYVSSPLRALPQRPSYRDTSPPSIPRRTR
ncbi:phosphoinositide 3-kinase adapter protein 1 [Hypomesus transpacificus]|uniref:phosphoinositide 3-kinase adapter protein 1 n=1 Tax=Hypomesus transpacificus TaxID=137520 RepID=UPI001F07BC3F|nr:phosphoinositide 3-kinase adapter protein 1 [Hypomesus transpacificus]